MHIAEDPIFREAPTYQEVDGSSLVSDLPHRQPGQYWYHSDMTQKRKASKISKKLFVGSGKKLTQESVKSLHKLQGSRRQPKGGSLARSGKRYD